MLKLHILHRDQHVAPPPALRLPTRSKVPGRSQRASVGVDQPTKCLVSSKPLSRGVRAGNKDSSPHRKAGYVEAV
jgi:hypothetical protein